MDTIHNTVASADLALPPCPRPCGECYPGHHWLLDFDAEGEDAGAEPAPEEAQALVCKHCETTAWVDVDADDMPEI